MRIVVGLAGVVFAVLVVLAVLLSASGPSRTEWVLTQDPDGDTLHLDVVIGNGCKSLNRIDVAEIERRVMISAYVDTHGANCVDILNIEQHEVRLAAPVGDRELMGCDPPVRYSERGPGLVDCRSVKNSGTEWRLQEPPEGRVLKVVANVVSSCNSIDRVVVEESRDEVSVGVYVRAVSPLPTRECTADERAIERTTVELQEPLGDRKLVGCDRPVALQLDPATEKDCAKVIWPQPTGWTD